VSDAGPLAHLTEIEYLSLLSILKSLHIPEAVWLETVGQERVSGIEQLHRYSRAGQDGAGPRAALHGHGRAGADVSLKRCCS